MKRTLLLLIIVFISSISYSQENRLALVIGNGNYPSSILANPENDARAMQQQLENLGFKVLKYENLTQKQMKMAIDDFGEQLKEFKIGLFYYAGHGIQSKGYNYLIPINAKLTTERQVEYDCVQADRVLALMEDSDTDINIIILDACRNNPFERSWTRSSTGKGLAFMDAPSGTLIAYATAPGNTASDGTGKNGLYTEAILKSMKIPDITVLQMFQNVRNIVSQKSDKKQIPWESTSLTGDFYFNKSDSITVSIPPIKAEDDKYLFSNDDFGTKTSGVFIDARDNQQYEWVNIGRNIWMAENLNYESQQGSWCYENEESNCEVYGRLYDWKTANEVCPEGWHLSNQNDWFILAFHTTGAAFIKPTKSLSKPGYSINHLNYIKGIKDLSGMLKAEGTAIWQYPNTGASDKLGFKALPAGSYVPSEFRKFTGIYLETSFWIKNIEDDNSDTGLVESLIHFSNDLWRTSRPKDWGASVRCVKD
jgi:uncharacterized protein (TIGR02145 family)